MKVLVALAGEQARTAAHAKATLGKRLSFFG
jgi:hypothetical protein